MLRGLPGPLRAPQFRVSIQAPAKSIVQEQNSPVILVVDDEQNSHSRVKYNLEQTGFGVLTAQSGKV